MPTLNLAEALLARIAGPHRASEIVGDLLEQNSSPARLWLTLARITFALTWRWLLGFLLVPVLSFLVLIPETWAIAHHRGPSFPFDPWISHAMAFASAALCLTTITALIVARYGLRDRLTWTAAALWASLIAAASITWLPHAFPVTAVLLASALSALLLARPTRPLVLCVLVPAAAYALTSLVFIRLSHFTSIPGHPTTAIRNILFGLLTSLAGLVIEAIVLARLHPILLQPRIVPTEQ